MKAFLERIDGIVDLTPDSRNRVVDLWRVIALLAVVFGHWLAASVWVDPSGDVNVMNTLEWIPYAAWFTWVIQVMPVFFFVGGYANARALSSRASNRRTWLTIRANSGSWIEKSATIDPSARCSRPSASKSAPACSKFWEIKPSRYCSSWALV